MSRRVPVVAIIGRTNVGKSSLFNTLTGKKRAIVEDHHGVTRDRRYGDAETKGYHYKLVDTGGYSGEERKEFQTSIREQVRIAVQESDVLLCLFDGIEGPSPFDNEVVQFVRQSRKPVLWVVNKCEKPVHQIAATEFYAMGLDEIITITAAHRGNIQQLNIALAQEFKKLNESFSKAAPIEDSECPPVRVALIGRPNVGKSTLINRILGENRCITSPIAGTTRDNVDISVTRNGRKYIFVDTAGLRRKSKVEDGTVERYGNLRSLRALAQCDVAVVVLDGSDDLGSLQDARLAGMAHERGRGLILLINKWDAVEKDHKTAKAYEAHIKEHFKFARYAPTLFISALTGKRCPSIIEEVQKVYDASRIKVPTSEVNKVLEAAFHKKTPPYYRGRPLKMSFATQIDTLPPTFVMFLNHPKKMNFGYKRYLKNSLRKAFGFHGVDIKIFFRKRSPDYKEVQAQKAAGE